MSKWLNLDKLKDGKKTHDFVGVEPELVPIREDLIKFHKQWKEADKLFRVPLWKRIIFFYRYRKQRKEMYELVNEVTSKMPTPTWEPTEAGEYRFSVGVTSEPLTSQRASSKGVEGSNK